MTAPGDTFGIYLHIPFCARRCDYCAFATWTDRDHLQQRYLQACRVDLQRQVDAGMPPATSIFVGGGTPSLVAAADLLAVLDAAPRAPGCEVTVETNPDDLDAEKVAAYLDGGVNRVSLGVQSMVPHVLTALGRTHDPDNVHRAVELLHHADVPTFNVDLIYGAAGETLDDWAHTVDAVLKLDTPHVSAYGLTVEAGTVLADDPFRHPDDDDQADKYHMVDEAFTGQGLDWYEISNWARAGHECRHNTLYWSMGDYQAIGCAGHSHRAGRRFWNLRTPERYVAAVEEGRSPVAAGEELDADDRRLEALQLALRTRAGVDPTAFPAGELDRLDGLLDVADGRAVLTPTGRLLANEVALRLH